MKKKLLVFMLVGICSVNLIACNKYNNESRQLQVEEETDADESDEKDKKEAETKSDPATETKVEQQDEKELLLSKLEGKWEYYISKGNTVGEMAITIDESGAYEMKLNAYGDELYYEGNPVGKLECSYSGKVKIEEFEDGYIASFVMDNTDDENLKGLSSAGDYYIDRIAQSEFEGEGRNLYLTQVNNGDSIISYYFRDMRPVFYENVNSEDYIETQGVTYYEVKNPSFEYYYNGQAQAKQAVTLNLISSEANEVTDYEDWFGMLGETQTSGYWSDEQYYYQLSGMLDYMYTSLEIYENETGKELYVINMSDFAKGEVFGNTGFEDCTSQGIRYALVKDDILYVATSHRTYFDACPQTGYITAIDLTTGNVLWKTQAGVCNSDTFAIVGDDIVCGYGFTNEPDYLYIVGTETGEVFEKIKVKTSPDYIYYKADENRVYVRCYDSNCVYETVAK